MTDKDWDKKVEQDVRRGLRGSKRLLEQYKDSAHGTCERCRKAPGRFLHTCPFACEINDDFESECNCCTECEHECAMDV